MLDSRLPPPTLAGGHARLPKGIARFIRFITLALEVRRERRMLLGLNEHALKDLGLRGDAHAEANRPFWDLPVERLCR